jgi:hypothetical protein
MASPKLPLEDASRTVLRDFTSELSEQYRPVLKKWVKKTGFLGKVREIGKRGRDFYDADTGVVAIVENNKIGPSSRMVIILNNGFRHLGKAPKPKTVPTGTTELPRDFIQQGPFKQMRGGREIKFLFTEIDKIEIRIEFEGTKITRVVGADGIEIPISKIRFEIGPNEHHAEMRLLAWAKRNGYRIVAMSPTRGCCSDCLARLQKYFGDGLDDAIPKHLQTPQGRRALLKNAKPTARLTPARSGNRAMEFTAKKNAVDMARLRNKSRGVIAKAALPNPKLIRIARFLKVAGPVMVALDAATSYAKASGQWHAGQRDIAAETLSEFGGRVAGAFVGAEGFGLLFGGVGSVIPGLGTTVGGLAGAMIGGIGGAYLGERDAKQLCHQITEWGKNAHPKNQPTKPKDKLADLPPIGSNDPDLKELQENMYEAGFERAEVDLIGRIVSDYPKLAPSSTAKTPKDVLEQLGSGLVDIGTPDEAIGSFANYPFTDIDGIGLAAQVDRPARFDTVYQRLIERLAPVSAGRGPDKRPLSPKPWWTRLTGPRVTEQVTGTMFAPLPRIVESGNISSNEQDAQIADLSTRVKSLGQKIKDYDGLAAGQLDTNSQDQLEADLGELRRIREQLTFLGATATQHLVIQRDLDEVKNRYEQVAEATRKARDQQDYLIKARADKERLGQLEEFQKQKQEEQDARDRLAAEQRTEAQNSPRLQERHLDGASRNQIEQETRNQEKQKRDQADPQRMDEQYSGPTGGKPSDNSERPRQDSVRGNVEDTLRHAPAPDDATKRRIEKVPPRQTDAPYSRTDAGDREHEDAVKRRNDEDTRKREEDTRKRNEDARNHEDDVRKKNREEARKREEADLAENEAARLREDALRRDQEESRRGKDNIRREKESARPRKDTVQTSNRVGVYFSRIIGNFVETAREYSFPKSNREDIRGREDATRRQNDADALTRRQRDADEKRLARADALARKDWERERERDAQRRLQHIAQLMKRDEKDRNQKARELQLRERDEARRRKEAETRRRQDEGDTRRRQHEAERRFREAENNRRSKEREAERHRREEELERSRQDRDADARLREQQRRSRPAPENRQTIFNAIQRSQWRSNGRNQKQGMAEREGLQKRRTAEREDLQKQSRAERDKRRLDNDARRRESDARREDNRRRQEDQQRNRDARREDNRRRQEDRQRKRDDNRNKGFTTRVTGRIKNWWK